MKNEDSFIIKNPTYIINHLSLLVKSKSLISAHIDNESFLTTLIEVSKEHNAIILDYGPNETLNQKVLANNILFKTEYQGIQVAFSGNKISKIRYDGEPAFMMPMPSSIHWQELRQYYRVKSPLSKESFCQFHLPDQEETIELKLHDISLTGFSMRVYANDFAEFLIKDSQAALLVPATQIDKAKIVLDSLGESELAFEICYNDIVNPDKVNKIQRLGCKFTKITPAFEGLIQRYMQQIQREELQKKA
ncbi:MAG: flagellar brake protein [Methylobacter sp.]|nr:flagellar brake protein [Methylobacter sp.]